MSYQEVKKYQQNFFADANNSLYQLYRFKPLPKRKPNNKWKITCVSVAYYNTSTNDIIPHCIWIRNCPLLTGYGNTTDGITSTNDILLGVMSSVIKNATSTEMSTTEVVAISFYVDDINQDPFELYWTHFTDPFNLVGVGTSKFMASFEITELELYN